jgi:hypothetical protein
MKYSHGKLGWGRGSGDEFGTVSRYDLSSGRRQMTIPATSGNPCQQAEPGSPPARR